VDITGNFLLSILFATLCFKRGSWDHEAVNGAISVGTLEAGQDVNICDQAWNRRRFVLGYLYHHGEMHVMNDLFLMSKIVSYKEEKNQNSIINSYAHCLQQYALVIT
jgi:hypothetical protein